MFENIDCICLQEVIFYGKGSLTNIQVCRPFANI